MGIPSEVKKISTIFLKKISTARIFFKKNTVKYYFIIYIFFPGGEQGTSGGREKKRLSAAMKCAGRGERERAVRRGRQAKKNG